jgi:hypothetical protein
MKIIEIETDDIGDIKTIIEILNGFIPEANADFIKDAKAYSESLNKKKTIKNSSDGTEEDIADSNSKKKDNSNSALKGKTAIVPEKNTKLSKKTKNKKEDTDEEPSKIKKAIKKGKSKEAVKEKKGKKEDTDEEVDEEVVKPKGKKKSTNKNKESTKGKKNKKSKKEDVSDASDQSKSDSDDSDASDDEEKEENRGEIKILTADPNQVMITFIVLKGYAFKKFIVHPDKYSVGLNLDELFKYIKNVDKEGTMSIHIDSDDTQHIIFDVKSENATSQESICELRVLNLSSKKDRRIEANVAMAVRINCQAFHKACKDLMQFSQFVEITCDPSQLAITCKGDLSNHKRIFKVDGTQNGIMIKTIKREYEDNGVPNIIRLVFDLKYINSMYKCSSLCEDMEIFLNTDSVMFLKYGIKIIGEMLVGISPSRKKKEQTDNYDENDDAFYQDDEEIQLK